MTRLFLALALFAASAPALAQGHAHADVQGGSPASEPAARPAECSPEHAAMGHCTPAKAPPPRPAAPACTPEHAAMGHCTLADEPGAPPSPAPACSAEHAAMGHCALPAEAVGIGPGAAVGSDGRRAPLEAPPAAAFAGPEHAADAIFGPGAMAAARRDLVREHGGLATLKVLVDRAELQVREGGDGYAWDAQAWYGGDIDKVWLKSEGEGALRGDIEEAEVQALWSRAIDPWFDLQLGVRQDFVPDARRTYLVAGLQGLAPYWFEIDAAAFVSHRGEVTARLEAEYDLRITQKLILQPSLEARFAFQDVPELALGSGLASAEIGARLRYRIAPRLAPYVGLAYEHGFGDTRRFRRLTMPMR